VGGLGWGSLVVFSGIVSSCFGSFLSSTVFVTVLLIIVIIVSWLDLLPF